MYKVLSLLLVFLFALNPIFSQKSLGSVSLTYHGLLNSEKDHSSEQTLKLNQNYVAAVAAYSVTKRLSLGYKFGLRQIVEESEIDGLKTKSTSIVHGPIVRYYFPIVKNIVAFSDLSYARYISSPSTSEHTNGSEIQSPLEYRNNQIKLDYGFAFYVKSYLSFDLKLNLAIYEANHTYKEEFDSGKMLKTETDKSFVWNLNGLPLSSATIGVRFIIR